MKKICTILCIMAAALGFQSCMKEVFSTDVAPGDDVAVRLVVSTPVNEDVKGRAVTGTTESDIIQVRIYIVEDGIYSYYVDGYGISTTNNVTTFTAKLRSTTSPVKIFIVANHKGNQAFPPQPGISEDALRRSLTVGFPDTSYDYIPMYGEYASANGFSSGRNITIDGIKMLRALARVDIDATAVGSDLQVTSIIAIRMNDEMRTIPDSAPDAKVTAPSVPELASSWVRMDTPVSGNISRGEIYVPESVSPGLAQSTTKASCLVVEGRYKGGPVSYYRIDFYPQKEIEGQILRNHRYSYRITDVHGQGWPTPDEASNNRSTKLEISVQEWDENTTDMFFDGNNHFGVSTREAVLEFNQGDEYNIAVQTDLDTYTIQWSDAAGTALAGSPMIYPSGSMTDTQGYFGVEVSSDGKDIMITALQQNSTSIEREAYILITAHRWNLHIKIRQRSFQTSNRSRPVRLYNIKADYGYMGNTVPGFGGHASEADGAPAGHWLRMKLTNGANFGFQGDVVSGGFEIYGEHTASASAVQTAIFPMFDVILLPFIPNSVMPAASHAKKVRQWLEENDNRVLIIALDNPTDYNRYVLEEFGITARKGSGNAYDSQYPVLSSPPVFMNGAFGQVTSFRQGGGDTTWGYINLAENPGFNFTPLLARNGTDTSVCALAVDMEKRIVVIGETQFWRANATGTDNNGALVLYNNNSVTNSAERLYANLFSWITETVLENN